MPAKSMRTRFCQIEIDGIKEAYTLGLITEEWGRGAIDKIIQDAASNWKETSGLYVSQGDIHRFKQTLDITLPYKDHYYQVAF